MELRGEVVMFLLDLVMAGLEVEAEVKLVRLVVIEGRCEQDFDADLETEAELPGVGVTLLDSLALSSGTIANEFLTMVSRNWASFSPPIYIEFEEASVAFEPDLALVPNEAENRDERELGLILRFGLFFSSTTENMGAD